MMKTKYFKLFFAAIFLGIVQMLFGQTLASDLDKKSLALGEPAVFKVTITGLNNADVAAAPKNELLPFHFEVIKDAAEKTTGTYTRTVEFAVFNEGKFSIPPLEFKVNGKVLKTIPYEVEVANTAKKGDQIHDIMNNKEVKLDFRDYWELYKFWVLGALAALALAFALFYIIRYSRRQKAGPVVETNKTLKELDALKKRGDIEAGDFRSFYVGLLDITRRFLSSQYHIPAEVLLTDDLLHYMKENNTLSAENEAAVAAVMQRGDMVKFAKILPSREAAEGDFSAIRDFVKRSAKDIEFENLRKDV